MSDGGFTGYFNGLFGYLSLECNFSVSSYLVPFSWTEMYKYVLPEKICLRIPNFSEIVNALTTDSDFCSNYSQLNTSAQEPEFYCE